MKYNLALKILIIVSLIGGISRFICGIISCIFSIKNKKVIALLYELTAGIMTSIVCFDVIPESINISGSLITIVGISIGIGFVYFCYLYEEKLKFNKSIKVLSETSIMIMFCMTFHNFLEGVAIGSSFCYSFSLGVSVLISMILHDIPEGIIVGIVTKIKSENNLKALKSSFFSGFLTGLGAFLGYLLGKINNIYISFCLSIAAGCMLYIVSCDLIPNSKFLTKDKKVYLAYVFGILTGLIIIKI